jgi:drug/metabolite transporter (DMT)-like permease
MQNGFMYLITVLIWGSTWLAIKFQLGVVAPEASIFYRFMAAAILLFGFIILRRLPLRFTLKDHFFIALQGLFLFSLNYILVYLAEGYLTSGLVAITFSTIILWNVIFNVVILKKAIQLRVLLGGVIGVAGLVLVFWPELSTFEVSGGRITGLILSFIGTISASLGNIVSARNQQHDLPVIQTNAFGMAYGALFMLGLSLFRGVSFTFDPSFEYIGSLIYLALFGSVIAFGSYLTLLGRIGPERAAYVTVLFPIIALALSTLFEGLAWNLLGILGVALVGVGNIVVLTKLRQAKATVSFTAGE